MSSREEAALQHAGAARAIALALRQDVGLAVRAPSEWQRVRDAGQVGVDRRGQPGGLGRNDLGLGLATNLGLGLATSLGLSRAVPSRLGLNRRLGRAIRASVRDGWPAFC